MLVLSLFVFACTVDASCSTSSCSIGRALLQQKVGHTSSAEVDTEADDGLITIVTTTSPFHGMPSINMITESLTSLRALPGFSKAASVIVADSPAPQSRWACPTEVAQYQQYLQTLSTHVAAATPPFQNTMLVQHGSHVGLNGTLFDAFSHIRTELVFINQHDLVFAKSVAAMPQILSALSSSMMQMVMFRRVHDCGFDVAEDGSVQFVDSRDGDDTWPCEFDRGGSVMISRWYSTDDHSYEVSGVRLLKAYGFSDASTLARTSWWFSKALPLVRTFGSYNLGGFEETLHKLFRQCSDQCDDEIKAASTGLYLFPAAAIDHLDGRTLPWPGHESDLADCKAADKVSSGIGIDAVFKSVDFQHDS